MKNTIKLFSILFVASYLVACGGGETGTLDNAIASNDLEQMNAKRSEIAASKAEILSQLEMLDAAIAALDTNKKLPLVTVSQLNSEGFDHFIEVQGDVMTDQNIMVYPEFAGILKKVHVKMGDKVSEGQLIATIDDGGLREQLQAAEYQAELAKTTFERQERLWKKDIGSEIQFLNAKTNAQASQKSVEQIKQQLEKAQVKAPFSGIVDDVIADEGQLLAPGQSPIVRVVNLSKMYVKSDVPESYLATVTKGKKVIVHFPVLDTSLMAVISEVSNYISPDNRTFKIEIDLPNAAGMVKPNLMAKVEINDYHSEKAILVPQSLISENSEGSQYLYKANMSNNGKTANARKVIIETGLKQGDMIEVISGLSANDFVIKEGARTVKDNQEVEIIK
jgi:RND family efflux transporter MFP subunit